MDTLRQSRVHEVKKLSEHLSYAKLYNYFLHLSVLLLAIALIQLATENKRLKEERKGRSRIVQKGDSLSVDGLRLIYGSPAVHTNRRQLIFVFTTTCEFCDKTTPLWKQIYSMVKAKDVEVFGICLDSSEKALAYLQQHGIGFPTYVPNSVPGFKELNHFSSVPLTLIVTRDGFVERLWLGLLSEYEAKEVANSLP
jgi:thiol-disulfide isomerase/thioredoxin